MLMKSDNMIPLVFNIWQDYVVTLIYSHCKPDHRCRQCNHQCIGLAGETGKKGGSCRNAVETLPG